MVHAVDHDGAAIAIAEGDVKDCAPFSDVDLGAGKHGVSVPAGSVTLNDRFHAV